MKRSSQFLVGKTGPVEQDDGKDQKGAEHH